MNLSTPLQMAAVFFVGLLTTFVAINGFPSHSGTSAEGTANDAKAQATTELQTTSDRLAIFEKFVPADATVLCVMSPAKILASPIAKITPPSLASSQSSKIEAIEFVENLEFVAFAATEKTLNNVATSQSTKAYKRIAAQLDNRGANSMASDAPSLTMVNHLNEGVSGMLQFKEATDWTPIKTLFTRDDGFNANFIETNCNGYRILACDQENTCVVIKLDSRTYVIGNKTQLIDALSSNASKSKIVSKWIADTKGRDFDGEIIFAIDLSSKLDSSLSQMLPLLSSSIEDFKIEINLQNGPLVFCRSSFAEPKESQELIRKTETQISHWIEEQESRLPSPKADEKFYFWQARQGLAIAKSIKFESTEKTASISIPRPHGFDSLVQEYSQRMNSMLEEIEQSREEFSFVANSVETGTVVIAKNRISRGTVISADDVMIESWPAELIPADALTDTESVLGRKAVEAMFKGGPIMKHHFGEVN